MLAQLQPLVDQLQRRRDFLRREIPRVLENSEDAAPVGRNERPDGPIHRFVYCSWGGATSVCIGLLGSYM